MRYSRQVLFYGIGEKGQAALAASRVVIVGCGALGAFQSSLLVRAGVGTVRLIDRDFVEESNLQRQVLFDEADVKDLLPKAVAAERKLRAVNSLVNVEGIVEDVNPSNVDRLLGGYDLVLDATDNFDVRFLVNDYCVMRGVPWIYGGCVASSGMVMTILPGETACLQCVFENAPPAGVSPTCDTAGIIGPIVGAVASLQAAEALKLLSGNRDRVNRDLMRLDLWANQMDHVKMPVRRNNCSCCGERQFSSLNGKRNPETTTLCGRDSVQICRTHAGHIDLELLAERLARVGKVEKNRYLLRVTVEGRVMTIFTDGRAIISGTHDPVLAKSLYSKYVGA